MAKNLQNSGLGNQKSRVFLKFHFGILRVPKNLRDSALRNGKFQKSNSNGNPVIFTGKRLVHFYEIRYSPIIHMMMINDFRTVVYCIVLQQQEKNIKINRYVGRYIALFNVQLIFIKKNL